MHNPRQTTLPGTGCLTEPLEIQLKLTVVPDETGWAALTPVQATNVIVDHLEDLGPGLHIHVEQKES